MDDELLSHYRRTPRPDFAKALYERINQPMPDSTPVLRRWSPLLATVSALAVLALLFTFPPAQAAAQDFLNLFRVRRFSAIAIDPARLEQIRDTKIDLEALVKQSGATPEMLKDAGEPKLVADPAAASQQAGFAVRAPSSLPSGTTLRETRVSGESVARFTADTRILRALLDALQISGVNVPSKLDGATVTVRKPAAVMMTYSLGGKETWTLLQSRSPEVVLPDGVSLSDLGEIALRIAGLSAGDARAFARTIDWHSTLLVPIPANAASFREVDVRGTTGLLITTGGTGGSSARFGDSARQQSLLLWSEGEMVFTLEAGFASTDVVEFANSLK